MTPEHSHLPKPEGQGRLQPPAPEIRTPDELAWWYTRPGNNIIEAMLHGQCWIDQESIAYTEMVSALHLAFADAIQKVDTESYTPSQVQRYITSRLKWQIMRVLRDHGWRSEGTQRKATIHGFETAPVVEMDAPTETGDDSVNRWEGLEDQDTPPTDEAASAPDAARYFRRVRLWITGEEDDRTDPTLADEIDRLIRVRFSDRHAWVFLHTYGLQEALGSEPRLQHEMADELGISRQRVSQIQIQVREWLRKQVEAYAAVHHPDEELHHVI